MSAEELAALWDEFRDQRDLVRKLGLKVDRMFWASVLCAIAVGGDKLVERVLAALT